MKNRFILLIILIKSNYYLFKASSYTYEHLDENGNYLFEFFDYHDEVIEGEFLIRVKIRSRFTFTTIHNTWIQYSKNPNKPITHWYCTCRAGARVLGTCSHTVSVLWYLGYAQHDQTALTKKSSMNLIKFCQNYALYEFRNDES